MAGYYRDKKVFLTEIRNLIADNRGKTLDVNKLIIKYGLQYGFSKLAIMSAFKPYEDLCIVEIGELEIKVKDVSQ